MKNLMIVLLGMVLLSGCSDARLNNNDNLPPIGNEDINSLINDDVDDETISDELLNDDEISGTVETIRNNSFEISIISTETVDGLLEDFVSHSDEKMIVIINEQTVFEIVQSDGFIELERWEGSFADISINRAVHISGENLGDEFLATKVLIWEFSWN